MRTFALVATICSALLLGLVLAPPSARAKPESNYTLKQVMQHLGAANAELQAGLVTNNRLMIKRGALAIADHPKPKGGLKPYIKKNHKKLMGTIKAMDTQVHDTARTIASKADDASLLELNELSHKITTGCIGCHNVFRD